MDIQRHVESQAVDVIFLQPHQGVVADELADFFAAVVGASQSPRGLRMPVVVEVDAAHAVFAPAVKLPQIEIAGAEVVVDDVQNHRQAGSMRRFDEPLEAARTAVVGFHGENARGVVSPRQLAGELGQGHHFHDVHAQSLQMVEFLQGFLKLVRLPIFLVVKGSQVHFINHEFVDRQEYGNRRLPSQSAGRRQPRCPPNW